MASNEVRYPLTSSGYFKLLLRLERKSLKQRVDPGRQQ